jgi:quinol monooxygenase YgiN
MSELQGIARFRFHDGMIDTYKELASQSMEIVRRIDPGTLQYDIYLNDDETEAVVIERYTDSESLAAHLANLGELGEAMLATAEVTGELLGDASEELRANLANSPVRLYKPYLSM